MHILDSLCAKVVSIKLLVRIPTRLNECRKGAEYRSIDADIFPTFKMIDVDVLFGSITVIVSTKRVSDVCRRDYIDRPEARASRDNRGYLVQWLKSPSASKTNRSARHSFQRMRSILH